MWRISKGLTDSQNFQNGIQSGHNVELRNGSTDCPRSVPIPASATTTMRAHVQVRADILTERAHFLPKEIGFEPI